MEYSAIEKLKYWWRYKNYFSNQSKQYDYFEDQKDSILIVLPDGEVAFDLATLFLEKIQSNDARIHFLVKDALINFYPQEMKESTLLFSYKDINSLGIPTSEFLEKIKELKYENMIDLNINFSRFSSFLLRACNPKVRMGFSYDNSKKYYNVILDTNYQRDLEGTFAMIQQFIKI
tara:strand:+ start:2025 stop:2549 length:525 start_codon:yes stop_codon:yes gene_type:complete